VKRGSADTELDAQTIAWILYAVAMASGSEPASRADISMLADAINHAVPTQQELSGSLRRLEALGLVEAKGRHFALTADGAAMLENAQASAKFVSKVWANLTLALGRHSDIMSQ
jgi:hypothetical protein